ncbi:MAG: TIGR04211 family SH3 domain-containing protein [Desulfobacteraceae bacterium]|nr:MAG: TIGR04211 family SH3 domain-containing protein [Desulfobacteraceae bacterium]
MMKRLWSAVLGLLLLSSSPLWAKTMFITDRIEVGVRSGIGIEQKFVATVKTGDRVEVLEGDQNWTKVRLPNGVVGWVSTRFLVDQVKVSQAADPKSLEELKSLKEINQNLVRQQENHKQEQEKLLKEIEEGKKAVNILQQERHQRLAPEQEQLKAQIQQLEKQAAEDKRQIAHWQQKEKYGNYNGLILWFLAGSGVLFLGLLLGWLANRGRKKTSRYY